jgi:SAM-dependent methyltransferase
MKEHWDRIYTDTEDNRLSWYEEFPAPAVKMLSECRLQKDEAILIAGAGTSTFVNYLAEKGFTKIYASDISSSALFKLKKNLGPVLSRHVTFIADDLTAPAGLNELSSIALWYDRAVLHFFTEEHQRLNYFALMNKIVKPGGYAILAEFSFEGPKKCSSLDTFNYDEILLQKYAGADFELTSHFNYRYITPSGIERDYIYTLFRKRD